MRVSVLTQPLGHGGIQLCFEITPHSKTRVWMIEQQPQSVL